MMGVVWFFLLFCQGLVVVELLWWCWLYPRVPEGYNRHWSLWNDGRWQEWWQSNGSKRDERTAKRWLAGEFEPPIAVAMFVFNEIFKR